MEFDDVGLMRDVTFGSSRVRWATNRVERYVTMMPCRSKRAISLVGWDGGVERCRDDERLLPPDNRCAPIAVGLGLK